MSGSGKTALGNELISKLQPSSEQWMLMDGDKFRSILGENLGHTVEDRRKSGERLVKLSHEFDRQGHNLIVCVLSIFHEHQKTNREYIDAYKEIYIDVSLNTLVKRDNKNLYASAQEGKISNVVGVDIPFIKPKNADFVFDNNRKRTSFSDVVDEILKEFNIENKNYSYTLNNHFNHKENYEYTSFEGLSFLDSYQNSREISLSYLADKLNYINELYYLEEDSEHFLFNDSSLTKNIFTKNELALNKKSSSKEIDTKQMLLESLESINSINIIESEVEKKCLLLQKRYEVSKRLFTKYSYPGFKKIGDQNQELSLYLLFGLLLSDFVYKFDFIEKKLIFFNTILKICDLISSSLEKLDTPCEVAMAKKLFESEKEIYKLLNKKLML